VLWHVQEGYAFAISSWARIYFMTFYIFAVVCIKNVWFSWDFCRYKRHHLFLFAFWKFTAFVSYDLLNISVDKILVELLTIRKWNLITKNMFNSSVKSVKIWTQYFQVVVAIIISFILEAFVFRIRNKTHEQDDNSTYSRYQSETCLTLLFLWAATSHPLCSVRRYLLIAARSRSLLW